MSMNKIQEKDLDHAAPRNAAWQLERMKQLHGDDFDPDVT